MGRAVTVHPPRRGYCEPGLKAALRCSGPPLSASDSGAPAVSAGKVYLLDRDDKVGDTLRVYDLSSGKELWSFAYAAPGRVEFPGSRSTPTVDGNYVYTVGLRGDLYCISTTTQKPVWHKNIWTDFGGGSAVPASPFAPPAEGGQLPIWGIVQNPLIYRNLLIVASQAPQAGVVAYDKATGDLKWKSDPLPGGAGYDTPSVIKVPSGDQLVMITGCTGIWPRRQRWQRQRY